MPFLKNMLTAYVVAFAAASCAPMPVEAFASPSSPTSPQTSGCLSGKVDSVTYSTARLSYGQADTASIGGTMLCPTCNVKPPLYAEFADRLERALETKETVQACYDNNGQVFQVTLQHEASVPFGSFDTPASGTTISGAVGVSGWALAMDGIASVNIYRAPLAGEAPGSNGLVLIGPATLVAGARPDVQSAYPNYPGASQAGFGLQLLTNQLPGTNGMGLGNGNYQIHAIATSNGGQVTDLGTKMIVANNATATRPFGTIDTPAQGGVASGAAYANFGWALTPLPNTIPTSGSTITVYIDNAPAGHPTYNLYRSDIATLFPGYNNSGGAVGVFVFDTTKLSNGVHTIAWVVTDSAGNAQGIGSRYFSVQN